MSVFWKQLINEAAEELRTAGISDAKTNAEYLMGHCLGLWKGSDIRAAFNNNASDDEVLRFKELVRRRLTHEPLQYIIGETEFYGLRLYCSPSALIPRPETEILVEEALAEAHRSSNGIRILDVGTGSGAIVCALASKLPDSKCIGVDISRDAITLAERNTKRHHLNNVSFVVLDIIRGESKLEGPFDMIVSNPPYIPASEIGELSEEVRAYEPIMALTDGEDGFSFYRLLAQQASKMLTPDGSLLVETEYKGARRVAEIFAGSGLAVTRIVNDLEGHERVVVAQRKT